MYRKIRGKTGRQRDDRLRDCGNGWETSDVRLREDTLVRNLKSSSLTEHQMFTLNLTEFVACRWKTRGTECYNNNIHE